MEWLIGIIASSVVGWALGHRAGMHACRMAHRLESKEINGQQYYIMKSR